MDNYWRAIRTATSRAGGPIFGSLRAHTRSGAVKRRTGVNLEFVRSFRDIGCDVGVQDGLGATGVGGGLSSPVVRMILMYGCC